MGTITCRALICGGGVVGTTLAAELAHQGHTVVLLDRRPPQTVGEHLTSNRVVALAPGAQRLLAHLGIWSSLAPGVAHAYGAMQVEAPGGQMRCLAHEHGLPQLGWIIDLPQLEASLWAHVSRHPRVTIKSPFHWHDWTPTSSGMRTRLVDDQGQFDATIHSDFLVAADGARSTLRSSAGIETETWDYNQQALVGVVTTRETNANTAWQRFTRHGPLALLPLSDGRSSLVWSIASHQARTWAQADLTVLLGAMNDALAESGGSTPFGAIESIEAPQWIPLIRRRAQSWVQGRLVLIGDAAHSVHPLAGQGLNMGLMDVAALGECLHQWSADDGHGLDRALSRYERWRLSDSTLEATGIHWINEGLKAPLGLGLQGMGWSLALAQHLWPLKHRLVQKACGIDRNSPAVARL